ncbi:hypothetical protein T459_16881 [Capsicum annuum]|uniref:Uncharacterized protein n=1 Tax=Capsicum annuum TaxID=4072 RepID=A0A2G2ZA32_CAPAN|nr:hypothetical protein T459_16881 [Capsicum annuum]
MLSYIDICAEFIEKFDFTAVKKLLVTRPTDEGETTVMASNISLINEPNVNIIDIGIGTDCESSDEEEDNEPIPSD